MKEKHHNPYVQKARRKALLKDFPGPDERRRKTFFNNLLTSLLIAIIRNWSVERQANTKDH